jgi:hypothetical protein
MAEHDIDAAGMTFLGRDPGGAADQQIGEAVAIDIARRGDTGAGTVGHCGAGDLEAAPAGRNIAQFDGRSGIGTAEDDIGFVRCRADGQIVDTVAVEIAGRGHPPARGVPGAFSEDFKTVVTGGDGAQIDRRRSARLPEHDIGRSGPLGILRVGDGADRHIADAIAIDVAGRGG